MSLENLSLAEIHGETAHFRDRISPHALDFGQYPLPSKPYEPGPAIPLEAVQGDTGRYLRTDDLLPFLSAYLYLSYGVTRVRQAGAIPFLLRTVPSAGGSIPAIFTWEWCLWSRGGETVTRQVCFIMIRPDTASSCWAITVTGLPILRR